MRTFSARSRSSDRDFRSLDSRLGLLIVPLAKPSFLLAPVPCPLFVDRDARACGVHRGQAFGGFDRPGCDRQLVPPDDLGGLERFGAPVETRPRVASFSRRQLPAIRLVLIGWAMLLVAQRERQLELRAQVPS